MPVQSQTVDVVAIRDANSKQVLTGADLLRGTVLDIAKLMEHPLETGAEIADHIVFQPVEIDLPMLIRGVQATQVFSELRQLYLAGTILTVQTRMRSYPDMVLLEIPHEENPEVSDAVWVNVKFREAKFVTAVYGGLVPRKVRHKAQASTAKKGGQQTTAVESKTASDLYKGSMLYRMTHGGR